MTEHSAPTIIANNSHLHLEQFIMLTMSALPFKKNLKIIGFNECSKTDQLQFMKMGIIPGTLLTLIRAAPFGDPIEISVRNARIALSKAMLKKLQVEVVSL